MGSNGLVGVALEMENRRKSGRGVVEWIFLPSPSTRTGSVTVEEKVVLLDDHPLYNRSAELAGTAMEEVANAAGAEVSTFDLGLTAKQRMDREGIVLPYFDAQRGEGGAGGRILYDMGVEDDFDEEEDEI